MDDARPLPTWVTESGGKQLVFTHRLGSVAWAADAAGAGLTLGVAVRQIRTGTPGGGPNVTPERGRRP